MPTDRTRLPLPEPHHWLYHNKTGVSVVHWSKQQPRWLADKSAASAFPDAHWFFDSFTADQMHAYADAETAALRDLVDMQRAALAAESISADEMREQVRILREAIQHYESALRDAWPEGAKGASWEFWNRARIVLSALEKT